MGKIGLIDLICIIFDYNAKFILKIIQIYPDWTNAFSALLHKIGAKKAIQVLALRSENI